MVNNYKKSILEATVKHLEGHIVKHKMNVEILLGSHVGVAEHPDVMETIEKELDIMAQYHDKLEMVNKYFL